MSVLLSVIAAYFPYAAVTAFTPGPNNILALHAVSQFGWRRSQKVIYGIAAGFLSVMLICGFFCWGLSQFLPAISTALINLGALYIIWLAWHIAHSQPEADEGRQASFLQGFALQFVNVKIYMLGITIFTAYVLPSSSEPLFAANNALALTLIGTAGFLTWGLAGSLLQKFINRYYRPFNLLMAAILLLCALDLLLGHN